MRSVITVLMVTLLFLSHKALAENSWALLDENPMGDYHIDLDSVKVDENKVWAWVKFTPKLPQHYEGKKYNMALSFTEFNCEVKAFRPLNHYLYFNETSVDIEKKPQEWEIPPPGTYMERYIDTVCMYVEELGNEPPQENRGEGF